MTKELLLESLIIIATKLPFPDYIWALTGGASMQIRGLPHNAKDIDILASLKFAESISEKFSSQIVVSLERTRKENIESSYTKFIVNSISIEVMADVSNCDFNGIWQPHVEWKDNIEIFTLDSIRIPILTLLYERKISKILGLKKRVKMISKFLQSL